MLVRALSGLSRNVCIFMNGTPSVYYKRENLLESSRNFDTDYFSCSFFLMVKMLNTNFNFFLISQETYFIACKNSDIVSVIS